MDTDDFLEPEVAAAAGLAAAVTAAALSQPVRRTARRGLVLGLAGVLAVADKIKAGVSGLVRDADGGPAAVQGLEAGAKAVVEEGGKEAVEAAL